jgi:hypothetical protein
MPASLSSLRKADENGPPPSLRSSDSLRRTVDVRLHSPTFRAPWLDRFDRPSLPSSCPGGQGVCPGAGAVRFRRGMRPSALQAALRRQKRSGPSAHAEGRTPCPPRPSNASSTERATDRKVEHEAPPDRWDRSTGVWGLIITPSLHHSITPACRPPLCAGLTCVGSFVKCALNARGVYP